MRPSDADDEFVGMADYAIESIHDLLRAGSKSLSGSHSGDGSHHPSRECFLVEIRGGHVSSASGMEGDPREAPAHVPTDRAVVPHPSAPTASAPPLQRRLWLEQLQARQRELDESRCEVEWERSQLEQGIEHHRAEQGRARAMALDLQRRIVEDDDGLPLFAQASQNIAAAAALLSGLPTPVIPQERKT